MSHGEKPRVFVGETVSLRGFSYYVIGGLFGLGWVSRKGGSYAGYTGRACDCRRADGGG